MANQELTGPDLGTEGALFSQLTDGGLLEGHFEGEPVALVRRGADVYAIGGRCTHYNGALAKGLFDGRLVRCPLHHACFDPQTGEAVRAPAFDPVATYSVERRSDRVFVTGRRPAESRPSKIEGPESVVIAGGGAAGLAAAEMLRRKGYDGPVTIVTADGAAPYDRPNVSKDYLAGKAPEEWMPLRSPDWYREHDVRVLTGRRAVELLPQNRRLTLDGGEAVAFGALLLATGASPVRLKVPGGDLPHVHTLRSLRDSRAIIERLGGAHRAVVVGASFIGLEVAASLRTRGLEVDVVASDAVPMERVLGKELGYLVRTLHESHGVRFHLKQTLGEIRPDAARLEDGKELKADFIVLGIGVRPELDLAQRAGLAVDRGVLVDEHLRTSAAGVWAAGDIARWPDPRSAEPIRVEHWVVAERQGQTAARNILGLDEPFTDAPFFWSQHYEMAISYVGRAEKWDAAVVDGVLDPASEAGCSVSYTANGRQLALATISRDRESLEAEVRMEQPRPVAI